MNSGRADFFTAAIDLSAAFSGPLHIFFSSAKHPQLVFSPLMITFFERHATIFGTEYEGKIYADYADIGFIGWRQGPCLAKWLYFFVLQHLFSFARWMTRNTSLVCCNKLMRRFTHYSPMAYCSLGKWICKISYDSITHRIYVCHTSSFLISNRNCWKIAGLCQERRPTFKKENRLNVPILSHSHFKDSTTHKHTHSTFTI